MQAAEPRCLRKFEALETPRVLEFDQELIGIELPTIQKRPNMQRAAFARALVHRPPLLLLDEPFSSLDVDLRQDMRATLRELRANLGFATIFVTHDREDANAVAIRRVALTRNGGVEESIADSEE